MTITYQVGFFLEPIRITHVVEEKVYEYGVKHGSNYQSEGYKRNEIRNKRFKRHNQKVS
jgi:hypothetical protein